MVSINTTMEIDLYGQCCSESIGHIQFSGTGGQADTAIGAQMSPGAKSIIATYILMGTGLPPHAVAILGMLSAFLVGVLVDRIVISKAQNVNPVSKQIITLGLIMIFLGLAPMIFGTDPLQFPRFVYGSHVIMGATISYNAIVNITVGIVIMIFLFIILQKSRWGLSVRATASNDIVARMMVAPTSSVNLS